jgi:hypothetical protein
MLVVCGLGDPSSTSTLISMRTFLPRRHRRVNGDILTGICIIFLEVQLGDTLLSFPTASRHVFGYVEDVGVRVLRDLTCIFHLL